MVIDGEAEFVGSNSERAHAAIAEAAGLPQKAEIELSAIAPDKLMVHVKAAAVQNGSLVMLAITEDNLATRVRAGEKNGRELRHAAVVRELRQLGKMQEGNFQAGVALKIAKEWKPADLRAVIFVQQGNSGAILGAASVPLYVQPR